MSLGDMVMAYACHPPADFASFPYQKEALDGVGLTPLTADSHFPKLVGMERSLMVSKILRQYFILSQHGSPAPSPTLSLLPPILRPLFCSHIPGKRKVQEGPSFTGFMPKHTFEDFFSKGLHINRDYRESVSGIFGMYQVSLQTSF